MRHHFFPILEETQKYFIIVTAGYNKQVLSNCVESLKMSRFLVILNPKGIYLTILLKCKDVIDAQNQKAHQCLAIGKALIISTQCAIFAAD